jgi:epoxide hydrolase-like predicted phosphatase
MTQPIKTTTLIFDFGGVLINLDIDACINRFKAIGVENVESYLSNYGQSGFFLEWERGGINLEEFHENVRAISSKNPTDQEIDEAWMAFLLDIPKEKTELLKQLRTRYRILMLSNTNPLHIDRNAKQAFAEHGTTQEELFDKCYLSYKIGLTKPSKEIFEYLLEKENLTPEECLFLDDGLKNIETARNMGFQTYLVQPKESLNFLKTSD